VSNALRYLALVAIVGYQRFISPYKGFCCAYRFHTGARSCSTLGYRAIRAHGVVRGLAILRQRLERCSITHASHAARASGAAQQRGVCDVVACVPLDLGALDCGAAACDVAACAPTPCDCWGPWHSTRNRGGEKKAATHEESGA
jgi:putative component of membrane protein insertase Oxa1/YidC/SpoIIIJ protein YidD